MSKFINDSKSSTTPRGISDDGGYTAADKAAVLALVLTLAARRQVDGPTPAFMVSAGAPTAGKSKVIETALSIGLGVEATGSSEPAS